MVEVRSLGCTLVTRATPYLSFLLTVECRNLWLAIRKRIVRWARRCVQAWRSLRLHVARHTRLTLLILRRRRKSRTTLPTSSHDALEQVCRTVSYRGRRWLCVGAMSWLGGTASLLQLVM